MEINFLNEWLFSLPNRSPFIVHLASMTLSSLCLGRLPSESLYSSSSSTENTSIHHVTVDSTVYLMYARFFTIHLHEIHFTDVVIGDDGISLSDFTEDHRNEIFASVGSTFIERGRGGMSFLSRIKWEKSVCFLDHLHRRTTDWWWWLN